MFSAPLSGGHKLWQPKPDFLYRRLAALRIVPRLPPAVPFRLRYAVQPGQPDWLLGAWSRRGHTRGNPDREPAGRHVSGATAAGSA